VFGREPNALELDRLQRSAAFATCNAKSHDGETVEERLERWNTQLRAEVRGDLVQARRNAWELAGHHGNSRGAINREQLRPRLLRPRLAGRRWADRRCGPSRRSTRRARHRWFATCRPHGRLRRSCAA
jgi:hypothetical protein